MTQNTPMQFVFSEAEFQQRCDNARGFYAGTIESPAARKQGAIVQLDYTNPVQAFEVWHEYRTKGYKPLDSASPLQSVIIESSALMELITLYLIKPQSKQEEELQVIYSKLRSEYVREIESLEAAHIDRHVELMMEQEQKAQEEERERIKSARREEMKGEMLVNRGAIRKRLISEGKLDANGFAL
jgi:hypothetical protein